MISRNTACLSRVILVLGVEKKRPRRFKFSMLGKRGPRRDALVLYARPKHCTLQGWPSERSFSVIPYAQGVTMSEVCRMRDHDMTCSKPPMCEVEKLDESCKTKGGALAHL